MSKQLLRIKSTGELGVNEGYGANLNSQSGKKQGFTIMINIVDPNDDYMPTGIIRHVNSSDLEPFRY